ncbi:MAG: C25 family cysteine peptidase [Planctomycetota bacterium]
MQKRILILGFFIGLCSSVLMFGATAAAQETEAVHATLQSGIADRGGEAIVVCPGQFREALQPWIQFRESQGIRIRLIDSAISAATLTTNVRESSSDDTVAIVLIGDAPAIGTSADPNRHVPMHYTATTVSAKFGSTRSLPTDLPYGDLDGDGRMDVAIGRLPVDTPEQLQRLIDRMKAYESSPDYSSWRSEVQLVGGVGGFGILADSAIETVTRTIVTGSLPGGVRTSIDYGSPGHRFYPRKRFREAIVDRYNLGCRFWVYAGHGQVEGLDRVPAGPTGIPVLDNQSLDGLGVPTERSPIALLLCCYTGAVDARVDSFAERMLKQDGGPIAVIAGTRVTMPYGNCSFTLGLIESIYGNDRTPPARRLGDAWRWAMNRLQEPETEEASQMQVLVNTVAALISPAGTNLAEERREHTRLYTLLGDPLLRLLPPKSAQVNAATGFDFGVPVTVKVTSPIDGDCTLTLNRALGQIAQGAPRGTDPNDTSIANITRTVQAGRPEEFTLTLDTNHTGNVLIRVHIAGVDDWAVGAAQTNVRPAAN